MFLKHFLNVSEILETSSNNGREMMPKFCEGCNGCFIYFIFSLIKC